MSHENTGENRAAVHAAEGPAAFLDPRQPHAAVSDLVMRFYNTLWNEWDDAAVDGTLAPQVTFRGSLGRQTVGRDGWRSYRDHLRHSAPDFRNEILELIANDDRATVRLRYTGTHLGPLLGIPATGRTFTYTGAAFFTASNGFITDIWVIGDLDELRRQLSERTPDCICPPTPGP